MATDHASFTPGAPETPQDPPAGDDQPATIGELFAAVSEQISALFRGEIELAKTKAQALAKRVGVGVALLVVAAVLALYLLGWVFHTIEVALTYALPAWASALIVVGLLLIVVGVLALAGVKQLQKGQEQTPKPQDGLRKDIDALKKGLGK